MESLSWKDWSKSFVIPVASLFLIGCLIWLFNIPNSNWRVWNFIWLFLVMNAANLLPFGSMSGGRIIRPALLTTSHRAIATFGILGIIGLTATSLTVKPWITFVVKDFEYCFFVVWGFLHVYKFWLTRRKVEAPTLSPMKIVATAVGYKALLLTTMIFFMMVGGLMGQGIYQENVLVRFEPRNLTDVRGEVHVHHVPLSWDARGTMTELVNAAKKNGVRWLICTDHIGNLPPGSYPDEIDGVTIIYGQERHWKEDTSIFRASLKDPEATLNLHGHVEEFGSDGNPEWEHWDAIELVNFHANVRQNFGALFRNILMNPKELYPSLTMPIPKNFDYWQRLAEKEGRPIPIFAGPDAHQNVNLLGVQLDPYWLTLGLVSTHLWIEGDKKLNQASIFRAIKKGRTFIAFDYLGDTTGFGFYAESERTWLRSLTGDTIEKPAKLIVSTPGSSRKNSDEIRIFRDNKLVKVSIGDTDWKATITNPGTGFWRVELWRDGYPWIISGQILVK